MSRRIVQVVAGLRNPPTAISINPIIPIRRAGRGGCVGSVLSYGMIANMETDSYWRTRCVGEAMDQGYTFLRLTCAWGRITDFPFPLLLRRRGVSRHTLHRQLRFLPPEVRKHIAARRGSFSNERPGACPTMTP